MAEMDAAPRLLVCTEGFPPQVTGSSVVAWRLLCATAQDVRYLVATAVPGPSAPGIETVAADLPAAFYRHDFRVGLSDYFRILSVPYLVRRFLPAARAFRPDAVLSIFPSDRFLLLGHRLAATLGVPHAVHFHNLWEEVIRYAASHGGCAADRAKARLAERREREIVLRARARFALTPPMAGFLSAKHGASFSVLPHAFPPAPGIPPADAAGPRDGLDLVMAGSVYAINAASLRVLLDILRTRDDVRLAITTGQRASYLESIGVSGARNVTIAHFPDEDLFSRRMARADACVVCLAGEGHSPEDVATALPTRAVESLRFGKPLLAIAPRDAYLYRFVGEHGVGVAAPPGDPQAVSAGLDLLLGDERRAEFSENARRVFRDRFSTESVGPAWVGDVRGFARHRG